MGTCPADMARTMITENGERRKLNGAQYGYKEWRKKKAERCALWLQKMEGEKDDETGTATGFCKED